MSLIKVPILNKLNSDNGTLYNFTQFNNDLIKSFASAGRIKVVPSKFACLNLPAWHNVEERHMYMAPDKIAPNLTESDPNVLFPKLLQNYSENLFAHSANDNVIDDNVMEWSLWKLLSTLGALNLTSTDNVVEDLFDDSIVSYVGDINVMNYVEYGNRTYSELYIHIPSNALALKDIKWLSKSNSAAGSSLSKLPISGTGQDLSLGLEASTTEITTAVYDLDNAGNFINNYDFSKRSNKATLDFSSGINGDANSDFEFNAIAMYYDVLVYDAAGTTVISSVTKLGSIFFIDKFELDTVSNSWKIPTVTKYNNAENNTNTGNAIAYRLCTNIFAPGEQGTIDTIINQYNSVSMDLYSAALQQMLKTAELFKESNLDVTKIADLISTMNLSQELQNRIIANENKVAELTNSLNAVIGASGYTVTNMQLLDAFAKLSNDFKGLNGQNVHNEFHFAGDTTNVNTQQIQFNDGYTYVTRNGKISIAYSDDSFYTSGIIRNRLLSPVSINHSANGNILTINVKTSDAKLSYAIDNKLQSSTQVNQNVSISFTTGTNVISYVLVINGATGKLECHDFVNIKSTMLKGYAMVGTFSISTKDFYTANGLSITYNAASKGAVLNNDLVVLLDERQGSYKTGDKLYAGTLLSDIVSKMLVDESKLVIKQPTINVDISDVLVSQLPGYTEIVNVDAKFTQNDAGDMTKFVINSTDFSFDLEIDLTEDDLKLTSGTNTRKTWYPTIDGEANNVVSSLNESIFIVKQEDGSLQATSESLTLTAIDGATNVVITQVSNIDGIVRNSIKFNLATTIGNVTIHSRFNAEVPSAIYSFELPMSFKQSDVITFNSSASFTDGPIKYNAIGLPIADRVYAGTITSSIRIAAGNNAMFLSLDNEYAGNDINVNNLAGVVHGGLKHDATTLMKVDNISHNFYYIVVPNNVRNIPVDVILDEHIRTNITHIVSKSGYQGIINGVSYKFYKLNLQCPFIQTTEMYVTLAVG